ncbi:MAG: hypothetical protein Q9170_001854 [Blastenia crenularia]
MIVNPVLALAALVNITSSFVPIRPNSISPTLCFDDRYVKSAPSYGDCATIISRQIAVRHTINVQTFARHPIRSEIGVPKEWTNNGDCVVRIDIPDLPGRKEQKAEASMVDVKEAAAEVLKDCVERGEHMGGIVATGKSWNLQVSVFAKEEATSNE